MTGINKELAAAASDGKTLMLRSVERNEPGTG